MMNPPLHPSGRSRPVSISRPDVEALLVQHGYRLTQPRAAVVDAVLRHQRPFTAEQLVAELATRDGHGIGRATIYRTLEILASIDVLTRVLQADGHPAYICDPPGHRHHILCSNCGTAVAFTACPMDQLATTLAQETAFEIQDHVLEVFGVCPACQSA